MAPLPSGEPLPELLRPLFWDYNFDQLSWPAHRDLVIARILQEGADSAVAWLLRKEPRQELAAWLRARAGAGLDPRGLRLWQALLDLPESEVAPWMQRARSSPGKTV